ncbi:hypothetical protein PFISCL1PPCAC_9218, partial [Pristionchus fissidentatus]
AKKKRRAEFEDECEFREAELTRKAEEHRQKTKGKSPIDKDETVLDKDGEWYLDNAEECRIKEILEDLRGQRKYGDEEIVAAIKECREKEQQVDNPLNFYIERLLKRLERTIVDPEGMKNESLLASKSETRQSFRAVERQWNDDLLDRLELRLKQLEEEQKEYEKNKMGEDKKKEEGAEATGNSTDQHE